jgi:Polyketide cyclase / dehydrase and lipid transport
MNTTKPIITFRVSVPTTASPAQVYRLLSDVRTHLVWAGEEAPKKDFRLLTMDAPADPATVGTTFSSTGANAMHSTFHDRATVVVAEPGRGFGFDVDSTLERKRTKAWRSKFAHRYSIDPSASGAVISYTCEVRPQNYVPYWLRPWMRPMTRVMVQSAIRKHMQNLAKMAERAPVASRG